MSNILIVGADQGIGYWMVSSFLEKGNKVTVLDIREEHINELKDKYPNSLLVVKADATDEASLSDGIKAAINEFGMVDIAIHNACFCTFESEPDTGSLFHSHELCFLFIEIVIHITTKSTCFPCLFKCNIFCIT